MALNDKVASPGEKLLYGIPDAVKLSSVCRSTLYRKMDARRLAAIKIGKRRLIPAASLRAWIANAPAA
jgi:excisionase family DNA binding protein